MTQSVIEFCQHGKFGYPLVVLHGGPGAPASATALAYGLADSFQVIEPFQRGSGDLPLTVASHISDLDQLLALLFQPTEKPALIGESWGAMLALAYAAAHPNKVGPLILVGCGSFDPIARAKLQKNINERMQKPLRDELKNLEQLDLNSGMKLREQYRLCQPLYHFNPITIAEDHDPLDSFDVSAHEQTWADMVRLQREGVFPKAFTAIKSPVLMLHGAYDPHPGNLIRDNLKTHLPQLEYHEWHACGHSPWLEKSVRDDFFQKMKTWLSHRLSMAT